MWALNDFTLENGATRVVPKSHHWVHPRAPTDEDEVVQAPMTKGSALFYLGSVWHGGGANATDERRVGLAMNYCAGFIRQQENQQLGIPVETVRGFSPRLRQLVGYGTYHSLIGHIDKQSPAQALLGRDDGFRSVWDLIESPVSE